MPKKKNTAKDILWPEDTNVVLRACFLYVGQGSSIALLVRDGKEYHTLLIDSNLDKTRDGIDVAAFIKDLVSDGKLHAYVNTHPHDDHLRGVKEVRSAVTVENVWHSGHKPSKEHGNYYSDLQSLIKDVKKRNGEDAVVEFLGSRSATKLFDAEYHCLAPAMHVNDDVNDEEADKRYARIHENCAVLRFGTKRGERESWVLITGDADLTAFKEHITDYHKDRLASVVLDASHHGSRSFFMAKEGDAPYLDALKAIDPSYVVISAPKAKDSPHDHPHDDAVKLYTDHVGKGNVFHTGKNSESFYVDIFADGTASGILSDDGKLAEAYPLQDDDAEDEEQENASTDKAERSHLERLREAAAISTPSRPWRRE